MLTKLTITDIGTPELTRQEMEYLATKFISGEQHIRLVTEAGLDIHIDMADNPSLTVETKWSSDV